MGLEKELVMGTVAVVFFIAGLMVAFERIVLRAAGPAEKSRLNLYQLMRRGGWMDLLPFALSVLLLAVIGFLMLSL